LLLGCGLGKMGRLLLVRGTISMPWKEPAILWAGARQGKL